MSKIESGWYIPKTGKPRWVLATSPTHVLYGTGGGTHREILMRTFRRWARRMKAERKTTQ